MEWLEWGWAPRSPAAVRTDYQSAELKTAQDSTKSNLDSGVTIVLRKRTKLGKMEHIKKHLETQTIQLFFGGSMGRYRRYFTRSSDVEEQSCPYVYVCIFLERVNSCHQTLKILPEPSFPLYPKEPLRDCPGNWVKCKTSHSGRIPKLDTQEVCPLPLNTSMWGSLALWLHLAHVLAPIECLIGKYSFLVSPL